jgi:hypothetical protein
MYHWMIAIDTIHCRTTGLIPPIIVFDYMNLTFPSLTVQYRNLTFHSMDHSGVLVNCEIVHPHSTQEALAPYFD